MAFCCIIFFYQLTAILVTALLDATVKVWAIIEILQGHFIRKVSSLPVSIASDSRYFLSSWICFSVTKYSNLQLPIEVCIYREAVVSQLGEKRRKSEQRKEEDSTRRELHQTR